MYDFFIISIGSLLGSLIRWKIDNIFFVNILGCFIFGFINNLQISKRFKLFFCFGFCGSLTTFSGWISELLNIFNQDLYFLFLFRITLFLVIGFSAFYFGYCISRSLKQLKKWDILVKFSTVVEYVINNSH